jgi:hypothetical protein
VFILLFFTLSPHNMFRALGPSYYLTILEEDRNKKQCMSAVLRVSVGWDERGPNSWTAE